MCSVHESVCVRIKATSARKDEDKIEYVCTTRNQCRSARRLTVKVVMSRICKKRMVKEAYQTKE